MGGPPTARLGVAPVDRSPTGRLDLQIVLASALPWLLFVVSDVTGAGGRALQMVLVYLGATHGLASIGLLIDPGLRPHVQHHRRFYLGVPVVAVVGCVALFGLAPDAIVRAAVVALLVWQIQHYTKQNVGMLAFWARARGGASPSLAERRLVLATSAIGIAGVVRLADLGPTFDQWARTVGLVSAGALAVAAVVVVGRRDLPRLGIHLGLIAFYLPVILARTDLFIAAYAYFAAHGAQYYLMVDRATRPTRRSLMGAVILLGVVGPFFTLAGMVDPLGAAAVVFGLYKGVVVSHFLWDTRLWRLRDPEVGAFMRRRFGF